MQTTINKKETSAEETALTKTSKDLLMRHLKSFMDNDIDAIISDYTDQSIFITPNQTYKGVAEIRAFFIDLMIDFPTKDTSFELDVMAVQDELALIVWHAKTPTIKVILGTDTLVIKDNKIREQTFVEMAKFTR